MTRRRLESIPAALLVAAALGWAPHSAVAEPGSGPGRLIDLLDVVPEPCPSAAGPETWCGRFAGSFDALKIDLELILRRADMSGVRPDGAWSLSGGVYRRTIRMDAEPVEIAFDAEARRVRLVGAAIADLLVRGTADGPRAAPRGRVGEPTYDLPAGATAPERLEATVIHPAVPELARIDRVGGRVVVEGTVGTEGRPQAVTAGVAEPRGYRFEEAAVEAVEAWRFEPGSLEGAPIAVTFRVLVEFPG